MLARFRLTGSAFSRYRIKNWQVVGETRMFSDLNERVRDVAQSPEGWLYFVTDSGKLYQISPLER